MSTRQKMILFLLLVSMAMFSFSRAEAQQDVKSNCKLLGIILTQNREADRYAVVKPETGFGHLDLNNNKEINQTKEYIKKNLAIPDYDISPLLDALFEINRESLPIEIESDMTQGYFIDRKKQFDAYFEENGGGWVKLYKENPKVAGITTVSIPVYDKENNVLLVYEGIEHETSIN